MLNLSELVSLTRDMVEEPAGVPGYWDQVDFVDYLNESYQYHVSLLQEMRPEDNRQDDFMATYIDLVSDGNPNILLPPFVRGVLKVQATWQSSKPFMKPGTDEEMVRDVVGSATPGATVTNYTYGVFGPWLWINPAVATGQSIRVFCLIAAPDLLMGKTPSLAGSTTTIPLPSSEDAAQGQRIAKQFDDIYNNHYIAILSGADAGKIRRITDYVGSTRVATVDSAYSAALPASTDFAMIPALPSEFHRAVAIYAAIGLRQSKDEMWDHLAKRHELLLANLKMSRPVREAVIKTGRGSKAR